MDNDYFTTNVLAPLRKEFIPENRAQHPKLLVVHIDNCSIHTSGATQPFMSEHQMSRMPQLSYSPDLAPSDFYLFRTVKDRLERIHTRNGDDLFKQLLEIL
jgi:transposase